MTVKSKPKVEVVEGNYYLTLNQIKEHYYPKYISVSEINSQSIGTTITINNDTITIMSEPVEKYKIPNN